MACEACRAKVLSGKAGKIMGTGAPINGVRASLKSSVLVKDGALWKFENAGFPCSLVISFGNMDRRDRERSRR